MAPERREPTAHSSSKADEVSSHTGFLTDTDVPVQVVGTPLPVTDVKLPERVGRYIIRRLLGRGGFGAVWLADDEELQRQVAIKVPRRTQLSTEESVAEFLHEARMAAALKHANLVTIYDVGRLDDGACYVVMEYIQGRSLAEQFKLARLKVESAAQLVERVAEAVHQAHKQGLVHRDLKPANILLDESGQPHVVDFGLAIHEQQQPVLRGERSGTPAYMAPEQVRGESHRLDGRTDIWSLGVVLYELLTGRRPFIGPAGPDLFDEIEHRDPKPPRQIDDGIPSELERICLKCLSKRMTDRYPTAADLADDLRHFRLRPDALGSTKTDADEATRPRSAAPAENADIQTVVPKGLRSFDAGDADFFLHLLPGPTDRDGLPESIRFWKTRIEETDPDQTFSVGVMYGPSGCGKSSLVKAGLLPRLAGHVRTLYLEATADDTEPRLARLLHKALPELPSGSLAEMLGALRRGAGQPRRAKLLLVLDQFEQWLHARLDGPGDELIRALRQCDGGRVQCLVLVRDDFWMAATRFMRELDLRLVERQNSAAVDLFDLLHARRVLVEFGQSFGRLPHDTDDLDVGQEQFLCDALTGLAEEGKLVPVRLALFAEMVKGKPWTPATLRALGGIEGVGTTFLEETFSASTAPPAHRLHQRAARAVLSALLPESGSDIKGHQRSREQLLAASGYAATPGEFAGLLQILDSELRLVTPADDAEEGSGEEKAEGKRQKAEGGAVESPFLTGEIENRKSKIENPKSFQLTHDYLVPSLREWLTRHERRTRRGRARLCLAERSAEWNARPGRRRLPSLWEWLAIRLLTRPGDWSPAEHRWMRAGRRAHATRGLLASAALVALAIGGWRARSFIVEQQQAERAAGLVVSLSNAQTAQAPRIIEQLAPYRRWADPLLRSAYERAGPASRERLLASLALLPVDSTQISYLRDRLLTARPDDLQVIRDSLLSHRAEMVDALWHVLESGERSSDERLHAASALAGFDPESDRWRPLYRQVAGWLVETNPVQAGEWLAMLRPVTKDLVAPLAGIFRSTERPPAQRRAAANLLAVVADVARLVELIQNADAEQARELLPTLHSQRAAAVPLLERVLDEALAPEWKDRAAGSPWPLPDEATRARLERALGMVHDHFAFCQTLPVDSFAALADSLQAAGYRLVRLRPFYNSRNLQVAAVWRRDSGTVRWKIDLTADELRQQDADERSGKFRPVDVASYVLADDAPRDQARYAAVWAEESSDDGDVKLIVADDYDDYVANVWQPLDNHGYVAETHAIIENEGRVTVCAIWGKPRHTPEYRLFQIDANESNIDEIETELQTDVRVVKRPPPPPFAADITQKLERTEKLLQSKPRDIELRGNRGFNLFWLRRWQEADAAISELIDDYPQFAAYYYTRSLCLARLGREAEAQRDLDNLERYLKDADATQAARVTVSLMLGASAEQRAQFEAAIAERKHDPAFLHAAAFVYATAAWAIEEDRPEESQAFADRVVELLRQAFENGYDEFGNWLKPGFQAVWRRADFQELLREAGCDIQYTSAGKADTEYESRQIHGLGPKEQLAHARKLAEAGYRPKSLSVAFVAADRPLATASVWQRPVVAEAARDDLSRRQANCAAALLELGDDRRVWPALRPSPDPRLRSFLIQEFVACNVEAGRLVTRLESDSDEGTRQALLLYLAELPPQTIPPPDRDRLIGKLLGLYREDHDPGVHGACDLLLRRWGQARQVRQVDAELASDRPSEQRRWYVNREGQTLIVVPGPIEFWMGSPAYELHRNKFELRRRQRIPRSFALAAKEVTVEQYQRFLHDHPEMSDYVAGQFTPDLECPAIGLSWFQAAQYCRWLSEREGVPEDQMCYPTISEIKDGMKLPDDYLHRTGYRLPTSAEWECACRAGTETARPYGASDDLLKKYEWYVANSETRTWPVGGLLPNPWGCFDMLGNGLEWCQDAGPVTVPGARPGRPREDRERSRPVLAAEQRLVRGSMFAFPAATLRSAATASQPAENMIYTAIRPVRSLPSE
jgi:serine/threonine protein kinase/formylglycine-generating enzyme required for sulfatase activity